MQSACTVSRSIRARHPNVWRRVPKSLGGKPYISVTDKVEINKSIATGPYTYVGTEFERFGSSYLKMWPFWNLMEYRTL